MEEAFHSLTISNGMFSPEFLQKITDARPEVEGCTPADFSTEDETITDLRNHLNYLWNRCLMIWDRYGPSDENELPASKVRGFLQRMMGDLALDLKSHQMKQALGPEQPKLAYDLGGSLWHVIDSELQLDERPESKSKRATSAHNHLQGALTSSDHHGWGLVSNGRVMRILRKTNRPSIQEALEFDIEKMFNERLYADFCLFVMLTHGTRWSYDKENPMECWLERWYKSSKEEGLSVLEDLRMCVQHAANAFGTGIIRFSAGNQELRDRLRDEPECRDELQREIMRYMYKLIFLFVMEDRDLLLMKSEGLQDAEAEEIENGRKRYQIGYSTQRHREQIMSIKGDEHSNFFEEVKMILKSLYRGEPRLALPALGSYLFSTKSTPEIDKATMPNSDFLRTLYHLCTFTKKDGVRQRVHWKTLRETELGSVYESLLELRPSIDLENGTFTLVAESGNDRKSSGSYYTPSELVDHLITTTIDPLIEEAKEKAAQAVDSDEEYRDEVEKEILKLTVCDPACGSGHFLVAALERIAMELARNETGEHHPGLSYIRKWKRIASSRCIYGVDLNPLAVELCKVAIWMDTYDGTNPLSFLEGHIRHGNSLLGQRLEHMGLIPDDAIPKTWKDQRKAHRDYNSAQKKIATRNARKELKDLENEKELRAKRSNQVGLGAFMDLSAKVGGSKYSYLDDEKLDERIHSFRVAIEEKDIQKLVPADVRWTTFDLPSVIQDIAAEQATVTQMMESTFDEIQAKTMQLDGVVNDDRTNWAREVLDASMAMWWWPEPVFDDLEQLMAEPPTPLASMELNRYAAWLAHEYGIEGDVLPNRESFNRNIRGDEIRFRLIRAYTEQIAQEQSFFHWELEFAEVFFQQE